MQESDFIRIQHIIDSCESINQFVKNRCRADLDQDQMLAFAIIRALEIIGEAASRLSAETRHKIPQIPWADITGMRNRLIHGYFDVNYSVLWATVQKDVPDINKILKQFMEDSL